MTLDLIEVVCVYCDTLGGRQKKTLKCENDMFVLEVGPTLVCGHGNGQTEKDDQE